MEDHADRSVEWPRDQGVAKSAASTAVVAVNYNTKRLIAQLLYSLYACLGSVMRAPVVVDNASSDGSVHLLRALASSGWIELIENGRNLYHGPALNQAFDHLAKREANERHGVAAIWVLDSDCVILRPDTLDRATATMAETGAALVGQPIHDRWHAGDLAIHSLLVDPVQVWTSGIDSFQEHGEPAKALQESCGRHGLVTAAFPFTRRRWSYAASDAA